MNLYRLEVNGITEGGTSDPYTRVFIVGAKNTQAVELWFKQQVLFNGNRGHSVELVLENCPPDEEWQADVVLEER